jgi:hypothetical protein
MKTPVNHATRQAVDELLTLVDRQPRRLSNLTTPFLACHRSVTISSHTRKNRSMPLPRVLRLRLISRSCLTSIYLRHASRYFELYHPTGSIEIAHTSRYSHRTGKSELCILATRPLSTGAVISELKGSMANLTEEEDMELKRTDIRNSDIRRDFSVIHSKQMKKNHLFLGPARFVNVRVSIQ